MDAYTQTTPIKRGKRKPYIMKQTEPIPCEKCGKSFIKIKLHHATVPDCDTRPTIRQYDPVKYDRQFWRDACKRYRLKLKLKKLPLLTEQEVKKADPQ